MHALLPGTFDPVTNGHLALIRRAAKLFDQVTVGVYEAPDRRTLFSASERLSMLRESTSSLGNVAAAVYGGLTVDYARSIGARALVRGIRAQGDFGYEFSLAQFNDALDQSIETVCLVGSPRHAYISAGRIREVAALGRDVSQWVPQPVVIALRDRISDRP